METEIINNIANIYQLLAYFGFLAAFVITQFILKNQQKKQNKMLIETIKSNNNSIVDRIEELKKINNSLDLQSSFDVIDQVYMESALRIIVFLKRTLESNHLDVVGRKEEVKEKLITLVNNSYDNDRMMLSRIYYKYKPLSSVMDYENIDIIIDNTYDKLVKVNKSNIDITRKDLIDYVENTFKSIIQKDQLKISNS